jgi:hypothetical protein
MANRYPGCERLIHPFLLPAGSRGKLCYYRLHLICTFFSRSCLPLSITLHAAVPVHF